MTRLKSILKVIKIIIGVLATLAAPFFLFVIFQSFIQFPIKKLDPVNAVFTIIWLYALCYSLVFLSMRIRLPLCITGVLFFILGLAENYVYRFRSSFITPIDFFSIGTAANVAGNYDYTPTKEVLILSGCFILWFLVVFFFCPKKFAFPGVVGKVIEVLVGVFLLGILIVMTQYVRHYDAEGEGRLEVCSNAFHSFKNNTKEGAIIRFIYDTGYLTVKKPEGYSKKDQADLLGTYEDKAGSEGSITPDLPDIVVVMNESFSDPRVVGPIETNEDYMPFIHSLQEGRDNTVTGIMNVSIQGGNTPNTEFEFLTGNTLAFLPEGCIPFQQYLSKNVYSMPWYLSSLGYETLAMHPYLSNGWNRTGAYPALGFSDMKFLDYFEDMDTEYVRNYVSDRYFTKAIIKEVEKRNDDGPVFSFNVTMQNHASYSDDFDNFTKDIEVLVNDGVTHKDELETYLSLVKLSDRSLQDMIEHYEKSDRKTLVVFFGDHQPAVVNFEPVLYKMDTNRHNLTDEQMWSTYKVPFVIWANYDIEEKTGVETSANYLGNMVLEAAGIPLDAYRVFTKEFSERYPVISAIRTEDSSKKSSNLSEIYNELSDYERMQYYELFDRKVE